MTAQSHADTFHLHIAHLQALSEQLTADLRTIEAALARGDEMAHAVATSYMSGLGELNEHMADEMYRLQGLMHALAARATDATAAALGS